MPTAQCNGKPVYQHSGGDVLFQPTNRTYWVVSSSERATSCEDTGWISSRCVFSYSPCTGPDQRNSALYNKCGASPDGAGCAGRWQENSGCPEGQEWCTSPELAVTAGP